MNKGKGHIDQLTPTMMQQYLDGKLSTEMQHEVERYLLDHPFEAEAIEGLEAVGGVDLEVDLAHMKKSLVSEKKSDAKVISIWRQYWKVAAVVTVLIVSTFLILNIGQEQINSSDTELALNEELDSDDEKSIEAEIVAKKSIKTNNQTVEEDAHDEITQPKLEAEQKVNAVGDEELIAEIEDQEESPELAIAEDFDGVLAEADEKEVAEAPELARSEEIAQEVLTNKKVAASSMTEAKPARKIQIEEADDSIVDMLEGKLAGVSVLNEELGDPSTIEKTIRGKITSAENGSPLTGVNVVLKGTAKGAISNFDGNYELKIPEGENSLAISFIGYVKEEVEIGSRNTVNVKMSADVSALSEVVVTARALESEKKSLGYSVSKKKDMRRQHAEPLIGLEAYSNYLQDSLRYPQQAIENEVSGKVTLEITVSKTGQIMKVEVKQGLGYGCDEEAVRLINEEPEWQNAMKRGNPVEERISIDVEFKQ